MKTKSTRRMGASSSDTRNALIDAAAEIMNDEGVIALTSRRLADAVGLKRQIIHYYFGTMDDLVAAVIKSRGDDTAVMVQKALDEQNPLEFLFSPSKQVAASSYEMMAAALRRPDVGKAISESICKFRVMATDAVEKHLKENGVASPVKPVVIASLLIMIGNTQAVEAALGIDVGHAEVREFVDGLLQNLFSQASPSNAS